MDSYSFYKSLYDRELTRRTNLDNAVSLPVTILTIIVAANSYTVKDEKDIHNWSELAFKHLLLLSIGIVLVIAIFYIMRSFNNHFKGFAYRNFAYIGDIVKYEKQINEYNELPNVSDKIKFDDSIITKLADLTDDHIIFNDKRSKDLQKARTYLVISLILTAINYILLILNHIKL
ncbi:hypothetical protein G7074_01625 [Pedobacter sp. HDW13]|uniref:hypothetical protein n=1 Tax=Pedobacter sp. HDW13 TaxID=2714940 RepID=UPI00140D9E69|nr:hypothetical protein [Pedobacter sp. HDW13]QIL38090.1 hypothetical protein G7074_01625 [Pedobacter sp. HDW13]